MDDLRECGLLKRKDAEYRQKVLVLHGNSTLRWMHRIREFRYFESTTPTVQTSFLLMKNELKFKKKDGEEGDKENHFFNEGTKKLFKRSENVSVKQLNVLKRKNNYLISISFLAFRAHKNAPSYII